MGIKYDFKGNKSFRLLNIYERLNKGELINKADLAIDFGITHKTVQRDIDDLRAYFLEIYHKEMVIKYDKIKNGYYLARFERNWLTNEEVLAVCKILLESRAFEKEEFTTLINKLIEQVAPADKKRVESIINKERNNYIPLRHGKKLLLHIWELSSYINDHEIITFRYKRLDGTVKEHSVKPVGIMFSEYYFYLIAFMADDSKKYHTVFRIDRMYNTKSTNQKFRIPYKDEFNDGEFRKRVQFMYTGELQKVEFTCSAVSLEAIFDKLPTATIKEEKDGVYLIKAESYGKGILMWLGSQSEFIKIIKQPS